MLQPLNQIRVLFGYLSTQRRRQLLAVGILTIIGTATEVIGIGAVIPLLAVLSNTSLEQSNALVESISKNLGHFGITEPTFGIVLFFSLAMICAGLIRAILATTLTKTGIGIGEDLSLSVYEKILSRSYAAYVGTNRGQSIILIQKTRDLTSLIVQPFLTLLSASFIIISVITVAMIFEPLTTATAMGLIMVAYGVITGITKRRNLQNSKIISAGLNKLSALVSESVGGFRDIIIANLRFFYAKQFIALLHPLQGAVGSNQLLATVPRYGIETLGALGIAWLAYYWTNISSDGYSSSNALPLLGAIALGAQRLLPFFQQIYNSITTMRGNSSSLQDVLNVLGEEIPKQPTSLKKMISLQVEIRLVDVGFRFSENSPWIFRNVNLVIKRGSKTGFWGPSGSGKSTMMDLIMGLLLPSEGRIYIDDTELSPSSIRDWQNSIAHVPQRIYISDSTIIENIGFGIPKEQLDISRVRKAARMASIADVVENLEHGYETRTGDGGLRLSGGQLQRIGIARALYRDASVLFLDEVTSSLDPATAEGVMMPILDNQFRLTVITISHSESLLRGCDQIISFPLQTVS